MRTAGVAWPLQTAVIAFCRCDAVPVVTSRTLSVSFHALSSVQRHSRLIRVWRKDTCRGCDSNERSLTRSRGSRRMIIRCLNRIMLEPSEVVRSDDGGLFAKLSAADSRTQHVQSVLKAADGEPVRVGIVDRGLIDDATVRWREPNELPEGSPRPDIPGRKKDRKAAPTWRDLVVDLGTDERLLDQVHEERRPRVALMLALPRPLQLGRILPMISNLGVDTLVLCHASKVERMYFGSHLFRDPRKMREKLIEGLSQSGDTVLPKVIVARHLKIFLEDDLDRHFPRERWIRTVAHPTRLEALAGHAHDEAGERNGVQGGQCGASVGYRDLHGRGLRFAELEPPAGCDPADAGILVTIGPEGGWVEPDELELLQSFGFQAVTLGTKILRSDVAVCAALALAHAWVDERSRGGILSPN